MVLKNKKYKKNNILIINKIYLSLFVFLVFYPLRMPH